MNRTTTKPWQLKDWKIKRSLLLKESCEQCGGKDNLVLQHKWQPPSHQAIRVKVENDIILKMIREGKEASYAELPALQNPDFFVRACPNCHRQAFSERKTMSPRFRCPQCTHIFDQPVLRLNMQMKAVQAATITHRRFILNKYSREISSTIEEKKEEYHQRYISCKDTVTYCKKCAYLEDIHGKLLCSSCKKVYHPKQFKTCYECGVKEGRIRVLPTDAELEAFESELQPQEEEDHPPL